MKKYINKLKYILITLILVIIIFNIKIVMTSCKQASIIFFNNVFISVFPFIILSDILIYFDYHIFLKNVFGKLLKKIFNIDENISIIYILSILTSHPSNSVYIKNMLDNKLIDIKSANNILTYTYFPSISFVLASIGIKLYNSIYIGILLYLCMFLSNILIGIYLRKNNTFNNNYLPIKKDSFINTLSKSIYKAINTSLIILSNLIIFICIINLMKEYFNFNDVFFAILNGLFELTSGIISIYSLKISTSLKLFLTSFILNFSGICIIFQSVSILNEYKVNIKKILILKLIFSLISSVIFILLVLLVLPLQI